MRILGGLAAVAVSGLLGVGTANAAYPDRPIHYILHVSPGGATDVLARKLGQGLKKVLGVPIVVENRPGGRGAAEMAVLTQAHPDGYTIGSATSTHLAEFHQTLKQYNLKSISWIADLVDEPYLFAVNATSPIHTMAGLVKAIKAAPGKLVIAGFVRGSGANIAWEMFMKAAGLPSNDVNWVPYNSVGSGVTAVVGGHGVATVAYVGLVKDEVTAGKLRVIGILAKKRATEFPNVPTLTEQGLKAPDSWVQWRAIIGPKGIPQPIQQKLANAVHTVLQDPSLHKYIRDDSLVESFRGPAAATTFAEKQDKLTKKWLTQLGFVK